MAEPRRKRKEGAATPARRATATGRRPRPTPRERMEAGYAKAEVRNQAAREALMPLAEGERPPVVTVGAIVAAPGRALDRRRLVAGLKVNGSTPRLTLAAAPALIMGALAWGMWRARYGR